jgi:hypothetical protein
MTRFRLACRVVTRALALAAVVLAATAQSSCAPIRWVAKTTGVISPPTIDFTDAVPQDFELIVKVVDQANPAADYLVTIRRSGRCDYRAEVRTPRRRVNEGQFEVLDNQVQDLWLAVRAAKYGYLDARYPSSGEGPDKELGTQAFSVRASGLEKEVQTYFTRVPELETIRTKVLSLLPPKALVDTGKGDPVAGKSRQIVGDIQTKIFYPADDKRLDAVPADRRQPFGSWQDAMNYDFRPVDGFKPWESEP